MKVYFVSGLAAGCNVFDRIKLPYGFEKKYIEWYIPKEKETLEEYAENLSRFVDQSAPFSLIGYSFGGIVIQEMNRYLKPEKNIIISSIKDESEIPPLLRLGRKIHFTERFPMDFFSKDSILTELFTRYIYNIKPFESNKYLTCTDPFYLKWSIEKILNWKPSLKCENLYHIHGTDDHVFLFKLIKNAYRITSGDHMMVLKKNREISRLLEAILVNNLKLLI